MMGTSEFQKAKKGLLLVNCARADLIDQNALLEALASNKVAMAALDVLKPEPPFDLEPKDHNFKHKLMNHPQITVTPHIGASTIEAQERISLDLSRQLKKVLLS